MKLSPLVDENALEDSPRREQELPPRHAQLDVRVVVTRAVAAIAAEVRAHAHELTVCLGADPVWIAGDERRLTDMFTCLLHNAVTHTPPGGRLAVFVHVSGGCASVHVSDNGRGIQKGGLSGVFAPRAHAPDQPGRAAGDISLDESRRIVEWHDGDIIAHSDGPGHGSRFVVRLPALSIYRSTTRRA